MYVHWTIHYRWYLHAYASFSTSYVRTMVIKPSREPERHRKSQISRNHAKIAPYLLTTTKTKDQVESRLLLDVVVAQSTAILQLLTSKDQSLLVRWDTLLILDL